MNASKCHKKYCFCFLKVYIVVLKYTYMKKNNTNPAAIYMNSTDIIKAWEEKEGTTWRNGLKALLRIMFPGKTIHLMGSYTIWDKEENTLPIVVTF